MSTKTQQCESNRPLSKTACGVATNISRTTKRKTTAVTGSSLAGRVRVVYIAIVVYTPGVARILVGIAIKPKSVLRTTTVDVARSNLKVAEARRHNGGAAWLSTIIEINGNAVGGSVSETRERYRVSRVTVFWSLRKVDDRLCIPRIA